MKAQVTKEFPGRGDHDTSDRYFGVGEVIYGELATSAVKAGNAKKLPEKAEAEKAG